MTNDNTYDVAVIGAGIVGVSTALHLLMRGKRVALIDRRGAGEETSYGNAGLIESPRVLPYAFPSLSNALQILLGHAVGARIHYPSLPNNLSWIWKFYRESSPERRRLNGQLCRPLLANALEEHRHLMRGTDAEKHLTMAGCVWLYRTEASFARSAFDRDTATELGVGYELMEAADFRAIEPDLNPIYKKALRWKGNARLTNPGAVIKAYATRFQQEGGSFIRTDARHLSRAGEAWSADTASGAVKAREMVVCTGPWENELLAPLGYNFPLGLKRGYHRHFKAAGAAKLTHAFYDIDVGYLVMPMEQGYRLTTGAEFANLHAPPNPVQIDRALPFARQLFPLGEPVEEIAWMGSRPCFPDSLPVIDRAARHNGLWFNLGHNHLGLTMGPASGRLLAEMMCGEKPFCDPAPYRAERFSA